MNIGMLWFDNDPKVDLNTKVERAVAYYRNKYGLKPTLCYVHPKAFPTPETPDERVVVNGVELQPSRSVLPHHLWIGQAAQ